MAILFTGVAFALLAAVCWVIVGYVWGKNKELFWLAVVFGAFLGFIALFFVSFYGIEEGKGRSFEAAEKELVLSYPMANRMELETGDVFSRMLVYHQAEGKSFEEALTTTLEVFISCGPLIRYYEGTIWVSSYLGEEISHGVTGEIITLTFCADWETNVVLDDDGDPFEGICGLTCEVELKERPIIQLAVSESSM